MIERLRQLVRRYIGGELDYEHFRHEFVERFLVAPDENAVAERICELIESECSAFDHGFLDELNFKEGLSSRFAWLGVTSSSRANNVLIEINTAIVYPTVDVWPESSGNRPSPPQAVQQSQPIRLQDLRLVRAVGDVA